MNFEHLYRASFYVMLFLATLTMSIEATVDNRAAMLYPPGVAVASALAFFVVDRKPGYGLSRTLAYALSWGVSTALVYVEYRITQHLLLSLAHWLVYLQVIKILMPKTIEDDWFLIALGLMQVLVGTVISQSDAVGASLLAWALTSLWVLGLFYLHREALRQRPVPGVKVTPEPVSRMPYPGLFDLSFLFASLRVVGITVALGGVIFLAMPRRPAAGASPRRGVAAKHLTGFGEELQLGQLGEILENDSVVMSVELSDGNNRLVKPEGELLWRGISMIQYENGRWQRAPIQSRGLSSTLIASTPREHRLHQRIKLEPTDTTVLFALRPILDANAERGLPPELNRVDGSLHRGDLRVGGFDYEVISSTDPQADTQPFEVFPRHVADYQQVPEPLKQHLKAIAEPVVASIPPSKLLERARRLESYLRDSGKFGYSLQMEVKDPALDPVEDFLVNRKEGHCAYFASALALMLRSLDIPSRMVNGFKGGDWNDLASVLTVRQKYAHSWVEVLVGAREQPNGRLRPVWVTLDPTPSLERDQAVEKVGGVPPSMRLFSDFIRYVWLFYVAGFDAERQERLVYQPLRQLAEQARRGFEMILRGGRGALRSLLLFNDVASFFSIRGFFVTFTALLILAVLYALGRWLARRLMRWIRGPDLDRSAMAVGVAFYRRLAQLLAEFGLERPPAETPREFARRAGGFLLGRGVESESVADVPPQVVDAFYRVRFGNRSLTAQDLEHLENRLDALDSSLHT